MEDCLTCQYKIECENEYGRIGIDEEDCTAVIGTHFCKASWQPFFDNCNKKRDC